MEQSKNSDEVQQYLDLLPSTEQEFFKANGTTQNYHDQLQRLVVVRPYPTLQILQKSELCIDKIIAAALNELLEINVNSYTPQFINFLANFPLKVLDASTLQQALLKRLTRTPVTIDFQLALLARRDTRLLELFRKNLQHSSQDCRYCLPSKEFVLYHALKNRQHFVPLICKQLKDFNAIKDVALRNNLLILKLAEEFSIGNQTLDYIGIISKTLSSFNVKDTPADLREIQQYFYADFQRLNLILEFLKQYSDIFKTIKVSTLLKATGVLELLYEHNIDASYDDTLRLIESTYRWQEQVSALACIREKELETLTYYKALCLIYEIITNDNIDQLHSRKLQQLHGLLRQIRNLIILCDIIEDIFQMIFLRWEQLHDSSNESIKSGRTKARKGNNMLSSEDDYDDDEVGPKIACPTVLRQTSCRHGFICRASAIKSIFSFLKLYVTKKLHSEDYKIASEHLQLRFQRIVDIICEALWKYSILEKVDESLQKAGGSTIHQTLAPEELLQLVQMHADTLDKTSSDDDSRERCNYASLSRRKAKKRRRATISGPIATQSGLNGEILLEKSRTNANQLRSYVSAIQSEGNNSLAQLQLRNLVSRISDRSIIPKMLSTPENLAIMALALKNFSDVKYIIETFHLQNTALNQDLHFVEQQQQIKQKLSTIYVNYMQQEAAQCRSSSSEPLATVEQIKNVAARGFEMSKIISVVNNFAQEHKITQSTELQQLLQKFSNNGQYDFLKEYEERNLNAVIILDLIINLPLNREITMHLLTVMRRQQLINRETTVRSTATAKPQLVREKSQLPRDIGPMTFLDNLCECMRLFEQHKRVKISLNELLSNNSYPLKPAKLETQLNRESIFKTVYNKQPSELSSCENLKANVTLFQQLNSKQKYFSRFCAYVFQLARLLQLRDPNLEYHTNELLKQDPYNVIGELIYECNMTPLEIEANVSALNLNLVHVIALNICPEIAGRLRAREHDYHQQVTKQKLETIYNYIAQHNKLLAYLLQSIQQHEFLQSNNYEINALALANLLELPALATLAPMYNNNKVIAALCADRLSMRNFEQLTDKRLQLEVLLLVESKRDSVNRRIDRLITDLIQIDSKNILFADRINDVSLRAKLLQENFTKISTTRLAKELIECTLQDKHAERDIPAVLRQKLEKTLADINIYAKVSAVFKFETWPQAYDFGRQTPNAIFEKLLQLQHFSLCYEWCNVVHLAERFSTQHNILLATLLDAFLEFDDDRCGVREVDSFLLKIFETFPVPACVNFLDTHKDKFRSLSLLNYAINFLLCHARDPTSFKNYKISLSIFQQLTLKERKSFWNLLRYPLLIIEQLIMNAKFEILNKVINAARATLMDEKMALPMCAFCFDKRGNIYDIHSKTSPQKVRFQLGKHVDNSAFILLNFNLYQKNHIITNECIDLLLRIYATKALDYQISDIHSFSEQISQTTDMQMSLDSLCGAFQMPNLAPHREEWVRDEEATHCMCCRRAAFTMLMRRHHCRRCGRVVCFACSTHRMRIPELYEEVDVRVCNECHERSNEEATNEREESSSPEKSSNIFGSASPRQRAKDSYKWSLSGNITHDKLLREEFCYEHAPSVALSLSILNYHLGHEKYVDLLLYHCRKLEMLIVPNPEVDYELVAKMMNCLAVAAKVRGAPADIESIREHAEIIISVVQHGCESLIPPGPLNLAKLADSLVQAEHWSLALEVHLKCGFPTAGVRAAHGLACLRAGCYETAREKFSHCMTRLSDDHSINMLYNILFNITSNDNNDNTSSLRDIPYIKRPQRGPPLLQEILKLISVIPQAKPHPETLQRASLIRNSNTSLASLFSRRKEPYVVTPLHEPALNILNTLANLKHIAKGNYAECIAHEPNLMSKRSLSRSFDESMHYLLNYGSHADILLFLMNQQEFLAALKYYLAQQLDVELFVHHIFMFALRIGQLSSLIELMQNVDDSQFSVWRATLMQTCAYLEKQQHLNALYQLQMLLKDPIRASMTCVKFYSMHCENFQELHENAQHLRNAHLHLQTELELSQWDNINLEQQRSRKNSFGRRRASNVSSTTSLGASFAMQMDARTLNGHINTILRQLDVAKFLAECEKQESSSGTAEKGPNTLRILKQIRLESQRTLLPTLFEGSQDKIQLCILCLLCGRNIDEGFGLVYRIIQDYKLPSIKVFGGTAKYLALNHRLPDVEKLLNCITTNINTSTRELDELLSIAINSAVNTHEPEVKTALNNLAWKINSVDLRISSHIFIGQLKSAYLLAHKYDRLGDIRKILRQAELTNQLHIKKLCEKKLNINTTPALPSPPL